VTITTRSAWPDPSAASYIIEDPKLAQVVEEGAADLLWRRLEGRRAAELLAKGAARSPISMGTRP
jgi:hypothetical protein